jgi:AcrR family transcriptional regulator
MGRNKTIEDDELLRVARDVFRETGHTATTRDIAQAAGISQAVLYQRFGSKEDLFLRAMTPELPDVASLLGPYPPRSPKADLRRIAERLVEFFTSMLPTMLHVHAHPEINAAQLKKWHAKLPFVPLVKGLAARLRRMQEDGMIGPGNAEAAAHTLIAAVHTVALLETMMEGAHAEQRAAKVAAVVDVLWHGLAPREGPAAPSTAR